MKRDGDYFWITLNHLIPGKEYAFYYLVDGLLDIADPYANKILERKFDKGISPVAYPNLMEFRKNVKLILYLCGKRQNRNIHGK